MKRRDFLVGAAGVGAAVTLAACGNNSNTADSKAEPLGPDSKGKLTVFFWNKDQAPTVEANIAAFNKAYPGIVVETSLASYADYWTKLRTQAEGDQLPDVFWMNGVNIQVYASNGMLAPLDDLDVKWGDYPKSLVDLYTFDGKHYGVPKDFDTIGCWINKKIFEEAGVPVPTNGWTWEEHHDAARKIAAGGKYHGALIGVASGQETYYNTILQAGGYVIRDGKSGYDDPKTIAGIQYIADMIADGSVPSLQTMSDTPALELFLSGQGGILWGGSWRAVRMADAFSDPSQVVAVPLPKGERQATVIHGLSYVANAKSPNLEAAKTLVTYMTNKEAAETEASNGTAIPAFNGTQQPWVERFPEFDLGIFITAADEYAFPYPISKNTSAWASLEPEFLNPVFSGDVPAEQACRELAARMNELLAQE